MLLPTVTTWQDAGDRGREPDGLQFVKATDESEPHWRAKPPCGCRSDAARASTFASQNAVVSNPDNWNPLRLHLEGPVTFNRVSQNSSHTMNSLDTPFLSPNLRHPKGSGLYLSLFETHDSLKVFKYFWKYHALNFSSSHTDVLTISWRPVTGAAVLDGHVQSCEARTQHGPEKSFPQQDPHCSPAHIYQSGASPVM